MERFSISSTVKNYPPLPYEAMKNNILGKSFEISLVFIGEARAQKLNQTTRGKTYVPNVLSFPLSEKSGEIYIAPTVANKEAKKFSLTPKAYIGYLFIHGLLHLKGFDHGPKMERLEKRLLNQYNLS
jgi:probable rRNA maturation factor